MIVFWLIAAVAQIAGSSEDYQRAYAKCVVDFSVGLVPSNEPAELLVRAAEAECVGLFGKVRASRALEDLELIKRRPDFTVEDAEGITTAFVDSFKKSVQEQALKNVIIVRRDRAVKK